MNPGKSAVGNENDIILAFSQYGTSLFQHPHHRELVPVDPNLLADGVKVGEEGFGDVGADDAHLSLKVMVGLGYESSVLDEVIIYFFIIRENSAKLRPADFILPVLGDV